MAALKALADRFPAWIMGQITGSPFTSDYTVKMYNQDGTRYQDILFDKTGNLLSNGWEMAWLSNDYLEWVENGKNLCAYEIWPQIYEKAWALMNGGNYQSLDYGHSVDMAWKALTGKNATQVNCTGMDSNGILQVINNAVAVGKIVCVATKPLANAKELTDANGLAGMATDAHAYYLTGDTINGYTLNNPWGKKIVNNSTAISQNVLMQDLKDKSGVLDISQYIYCVYILDPII